MAIMTRLDRLMRYIREDRLNRFKVYIKKHKLDVKNLSLSKGRTLLHYAAKHGSGSFVKYLLGKKVSATQVSAKGDLPLHVALRRGLVLQTSHSAEVYFDVVMPLLESFPIGLDQDDHHGDSGSNLLSSLKKHLKKENHCQASTCFETCTDDIWNEKLISEFESEVDDYSWHYDYSGASLEREQETYDEWADRLWSEHQRKHYHNANIWMDKDKRKRKSSDLNTSKSKSFASETCEEDDLKKARNDLQESYSFNANEHKKEYFQTRKMNYEINYQKALNDKKKNMHFADIPWPCSGTVETMMEVLFCDIPLDGPLKKKYIKEQQIRWHPDKFLQRFSDRLEHSSKAKILDLVNQISQAINKNADVILNDKVIKE